MSIDEAACKSVAVNTYSSLGCSTTKDDKFRCRLPERHVLHVRIQNPNELRDIYNIGDKIGEGGFGVVVSVTDKNTNKTWAMKSIVKTMAAERLKMIKREIKILKLINHPHIIHLDKVYESNKEIYLILEKCCGELFDIYKKNKPFPEKTARKITQELAEAIAYLHKYGIVHRDLKMENILVGENPSDPDDMFYVKVTDFGLSIVKFGFGIDSMLHEYCGTITYMAPEMIKSRSYSQQCDNWGIGVILYMMVIGHYPFFSSDSNELKRKICNNEPDTKLIQYGKELNDLIRRLLAKDPAVRITACEVLEHPWITGAPSKRTTSGNIFDIMKQWKSELTLKDIQSPIQDNDNEQDPEKLVRVVNSRQPLPLTKTDIKFEKKTRDPSSKTMDTKKPSKDPSQSPETSRK